MKYFALVVWGEEDLCLYNLTDKTFEGCDANDPGFEFKGQHYFTLKKLKEEEASKVGLSFNPKYIPKIIQVWRE